MATDDARQAAEAVEFW
jgi:hypothetical protein